MLSGIRSSSQTPPKPPSSTNTKSQAEADSYIQTASTAFAKVASKNNTLTNIINTIRVGQPTVKYQQDDYKMMMKMDMNKKQRRVEQQQQQQHNVRVDDTWQ